MASGTLIPGTVFEKRHITVGGGATTLALEPPYWRLLEVLARRGGSDWRAVVHALLSAQPKGFKSRAGFLRLAVVKLALGALDPKLHGEMFPVPPAAGERA